MTRPTTTFNYRLERTPSIYTEISSSALGAIASVVASTVLYQMITHAVTPVSGLWWVLFGALVTIAAEHVSSAFGCIKRMLSGRVTVVEIESQPWHPGEVQRIRVANPDVSDLKSFEVTLEADDSLLPAAGAKPFSKRLHREKVFSVTGEDLVKIHYGLDLVARLSLPVEAEGKTWRWQIMVHCRPYNGPLREYSYPLPVDATLIATAKAS
jgi:hypothetical protein